jgi:hypothetical protein
MSSRDQTRLDAVVKPDASRRVVGPCACMTQGKPRHVLRFCRFSAIFPFFWFFVGFRALKHLRAFHVNFSRFFNFSLRAAFFHPCVVTRIGRAFLLVPQFANKRTCRILSFVFTCVVLLLLCLRVFSLFLHVWLSLR